MRSLLLSSLFGAAAALLVVACDGSSNAPAPAEDESEVVRAGDKEIARIGGSGSFAVDEDGAAYLVFDNALYRVSAGGEKKKIGDAPDKAASLTVTKKYVVLEANPLGGDTLTFYDRAHDYAPKVVPITDRGVGMLPAADDAVLMSFLDEGLVTISADGTRTKIYEPGQYITVRDMVPGLSLDTVYGLVDRFSQGQKLIEIDIKHKTTRDILTVGEGSFRYAFDKETKTFFSERSHVSLTNGNVIAIYDLNGQVVKQIDMQLNSGPVAVDKDAFYVMARLGPNGGSGSWKLLTFDKRTLEMTDRGRVEPKVYEMALHGSKLLYSHSKDSALPLRARSL